jgi:hypothetical protein
MLNSETQIYRQHDTSKLTTALQIALSTVFLLWVASTGASQIVVAFLFVAVGGVLVMMRPTAAIIAALIYLMVLGDVRRFVSMHAGQTGQDPLLLVGPAIVAMLFARLVFERKIGVDTPMAKLITGLMVIMVLEMVNPLQGGITVGVAGALFYLVPLLWYWIGRSMPTERTASVLLKGVFPVMAGLAALLGLYQTLFGFLSFESQWIREQIYNGFAAIVVEGSVVRAFSFFTSPGEYAMFLGLGLVCCAAPLAVGRFRAVSLLIPLLVWALFLESVRSAIVLAMVAVVGMWSLVGRDAQQILARAFLAVVIGGGGMYYVLHRLQDAGGLNDRTEALVMHTADGLLNPGESSATGHLSLALAGVKVGVKNPIGNGLGATTMAASKFGSKGGAGFDNDIANLFASLGVFGGGLYVVIIVYALYRAAVTWRDRRSYAAILTLGVLVSQLGCWLGGTYAVAAITWFLIGSLDRSWSRAEPEAFAPTATREPLRRVPAPAGAGVGAAAAPASRVRPPVTAGASDFP